MSETIKIGDYEVSEKEVDLFINTLSKEQQAYRGIPQFREQVRDRVEEICLFAMLGAEGDFEESADYKEAMALARRDILSQMAMADVLKKVSVTDEEVKEFFDANTSVFAKGASATARHILVDSEDKATEILAEIESGSKSFEDAAKEYSTCPSKERGGHLGTFGKGQMVKEFEDATFSGPVGKVLGPVKTQFGYHLILVEERTEEKAPEFDEVKEKASEYVLQKKQQETYEETLSKLKEKYEK